jgi:hypothetical protein
VTPEGENEERRTPQPGEADDRRPPSADLHPDLGWGEDNRSAQPPGERISWDEPEITEAAPSSAANLPTPTSAPTPAFPDRPIVRAPRAEPEPEAPKRPFTLRGVPPRRDEPNPREEPPAPPLSGPGPDAGVAPVLSAREPEPTPPVEPPAPPRAQPPAHLAPEAPAPRPSTLRPDLHGSGDEVAPAIADEVDTLKEQLRALVGLSGPNADAPTPPEPSFPPAAPDPEPERMAEPEPEPALDLHLRPLRPAPDRTAPALAELSQQLVATQSQVAAIGAQLTTLSHRLSYDLERSGQSMSERVLRDLSTVSEELRRTVGADLGPAIDDLTDQVETDRASLAAAIDAARDTIATRLATIGEVVDAQPLRNVEILSALQGLSSDLEDRLERLAGRINDQVVALERSTTAELTRLRSQVDELRAAVARPSSSAEAIERMTGQVERLVQRTPTTEELVESLELLVSEHLEVLRDNLDTRVGALAPLVQEELEAVRAESLAGTSAAEEQLAERIEVLEATLAERMDLAMADQIESIDALVSDRQAQLLGAIQAGVDDAPVAAPGDDHRLDEAAESAAAAVHRLDEVIAALGELHDLVADRPAIEVAPGSVDAEAMAQDSEELKALRRRISLRFEAEPAGGLTPDQIATLAAQISDHLH